MNCFDCANAGNVVPAVAICHDCGGGICIDHAVTTRPHLTRTATISRIIVVDPPARLIRCPTCTAARDAVQHDSPPRRHSGRDLTRSR
jgi:hypothetical protein